MNIRSLALAAASIFFILTNADVVSAQIGGLKKTIERATNPDSNPAQKSSDDSQSAPHNPGGRPGGYISPGQRREADARAANDVANKRDEAMRAEAAKIAASHPDDCNVTEPATRNGLAFYKPFSSDDTMADVWCKLQALPSTKPVQVKLFYQNGSVAMGNMVFQGRPERPTKKQFMNELAYNLMRLMMSDPYFFRELTQTYSTTLASRGVPDRVAESKYRWFPGRIEIGVSGVDIQSLPFDVTVIFGVNEGLIVQHFEKNMTNYVDVPAVPYVIGMAYPWTLQNVSLYTKNNRVSVVGPEIKRQILEKYAKNVKQRDVADPNSNDPKRRLSKIDDGAIAINIHEGDQRNPMPGPPPDPLSWPYFQISYFTVGAANPFVPGQAALKAYVTKLIDKDKQDTLKQVGKTPF